MVLQYLETAIGLEVQVNERGQHEQRAEQRVEEELYRGIDAIGAAPHTDDEEHGDQHRLEEDVEQHRIQPGEHAIHQPRHDEKRRQVLRDLLLDHFPRGDDDQHGDEAVQQHKKYGDAVHAQVVVDVEGGDPRRQFLELHAGAAGVELRVKGNSHEKSRQRADQGDELCEVGIAI